MTASEVAGVDLVRGTLAPCILYKLVYLDIGNVEIGLFHFGFEIFHLPTHTSVKLLAYSVLSGRLPHC